MDDIDTAQEIKLLLTSRRAAINPADFSELDFLGPHGDDGLTQDHLGRLLGVSDRHLRNIEAGRARATPSLLEGMVRVLRMNADERVLLYRLVLGHDPFPDHSMSTLPVGVRPAWEAILQASSYPGYVSGPDWEILAANAAYEELLPNFRLSAASNVMRYCLLDTGVRDTLLLDWLDDWARPMVAQVRAALPVLPDHAGLLRLIADMREDPIIDGLWREPPVPGLPKIHPNGDERRICHPRYGEQRLIITASTPMGYPDHRVITLVPIGMPGPPSASARVWSGYARAAGDASDAMRAAGRRKGASVPVKRAQASTRATMSGGPTTDPKER